MSYGKKHRYNMLYQTWLKGPVDAFYAGFNEKKNVRKRTKGVIEMLHS